MSEDLKITVNEYMPLRDVVFHTLRQAILKGEMEPGERLMEIQLAKKLGVSRTPIREAIRKLELEGLVLMIPRRGAEVAGITEKNLRDVLEVRRSLEELAIELAVQRMDNSDIARLEEARISFREALSTNDMIRIAQADELFHDVIYAGTYNDRLIQMLNNLRDQMYRYRLEYIKDTGKRQILMIEHENILSAVKNRNLELGKKAMREHIDNQELTISRNLANDPGQKKISEMRQAFILVPPMSSAAMRAAFLLTMLAPVISLLLLPAFFSVSPVLSAFTLPHSFSTAVKRFVISIGRVIAEPTTTVSTPSSIAFLSSSGVEIFPSATTGFPHSLTSVLIIS